MHLMYGSSSVEIRFHCRFRFGAFLTIFFCETVNSTSLKKREREFVRIFGFVLFMLDLGTIVQVNFGCLFRYSKKLLIFSLPCGYTRKVS